MKRTQDMERMGESRRRWDRRRTWEFGLLAAAIVAVSLYIGLRETDRIRYSLPQLADLQPNAVDSLIVRQGGTTVTLERKGERWLILPEGHAADSQAAADMVRAVAELTLSDLVSVSADYGRYGLDEGREIVVTASKNGGVLRELRVGESAGRRTFVRLQGDRRVFTVAENLRSLYDRDAESLRDRTVLSFAPETITTITAATEGAEHRISRAREEGEDGEALTVWRTAEGLQLDGEAVETTLNRLSSLQCVRYLQEQDIEGPPVLTVELRGAAAHRLTVYGSREDGHPAVSSAAEDPFLVSKWIIDDLRETVFPEPEAAAEPTGASAESDG